MSTRLWKCLQLAAVLLFVAASLTAALRVPHGGMPDEEGHANYVKALATGQGLPLSRSVTGVVRCNAGAGHPLYVSAQAHHPPVYYAPIALIYRIADYDENVLYTGGRLMGVALGVICLLLLRSSVYRALPNGDAVATVALIACAGSPTFTFIMGSLNNETLAVAVVCLGLWLSAPVLADARLSVSRAALLGVSLGLAMVVKLTAAVVIVPVIAAFVAYKSHITPPSHIFAQ